MSPGRKYKQFCGLARALDRLGERWTLLMVRELLLGPRRYRDFLASLPGLTTNLLAKRLKQLEVDSIIERVSVGRDRHPAYALTEHGRALEPVIMELGRWGGRFMDAPGESDRVDLAWGLISMKRRYQPSSSADTQDLVVGVETGGRHFTLVLGPNALEVSERQSDAARLRLRGPAPSFAQWLFRGASVRALIDAGQLEIDGEVDELARMVDAFSDLRL